MPHKRKKEQVFQQLQPFEEPPSSAIASGFTEFQASLQTNKAVVVGFGNERIGTIIDPNKGIITRKAKIYNMYTLFADDVDGVADEVEINDLITRCNSDGGGTVFIKRGTYNLAAPVVMKSNVILRGDGPTATILKQDSNINGDVLTGTTITNFGIYDLQVDGRKGGNATGDNGISLAAGCQYFTIQNVLTQNNVLKGISVESGKDGTIFNCWATANDQDGITVSTSTTDKSQGLRIIGCTSYNNSQYAFGIVTASTSHQVSKDISIIGCRGYANSTYGISIKGLDGGIVANNVIDDNDLEGIMLGDVTDAAYRADEVVVTGNVVKNNGTESSNRNGIRLQYTQDTLVVGNRCFDDQATFTQDYGIYLNNTTRPVVIGNEVNGNGIANMGGQTSPYIRYNNGWTTENNNWGVIVSGATSTTISHGLSVTPAAEDIAVVGANNPTNDPGHVWVDTITSTQFNVNCKSDPGASGFAFGWSILGT